MTDRRVVTRRRRTPPVSWAAVREYFPNVQPTTYLKPLPEHGVIYVKNPKAACSTLLLWLDRIYTGEPDFTPGNIHTETRLPTVSVVGRRRVTRMLSGSAYRFSFVRDPRRRLESAYWDKMVTKVEWSKRRGRAQLGLPIDTTPTFEQFLSAVERQDPMTEMNPHWRPQHVNLLHPLVSYDYIGRVENFQADLDRVCEESGLPRFTPEPRNVSARPATTSVYEGRPDLLRRVEALYADDLEMYGY